MTVETSYIIFSPLTTKTWFPDLLLTWTAYPKPVYLASHILLGKQRLTQLHRGLPQPSGWILSRLCAKWRKESEKRSRKMSHPRYHPGVSGPNTQPLLKAVLSSTEVGLRNPEPKPDQLKGKTVLLCKNAAFSFLCKGWHGVHPEVNHTQDPPHL